MIRRVFSALAACALVCGAADKLLAAPPFSTFSETQTVALANPHPVEGLGGSLDASGGLAIAGAINGTNGANETTGAAYVYRQSPSGQWNQVAKLWASDGLSNATFGSGVGLDGDWAIVQAKFHGNATSSSRYGSTYLFHRNSDTDWQQASEFLAPANTTSYFSTVSISGTQAVVSGDLRTSSVTTIGVVDVLEQTGPLAWSKTQHIELTAYKSSVRDVAIENGTLFVGAARQANSFDAFVNSVEVYQDTASGFTHSASISPPVTSPGFGNSIAADGDRVLIGAPAEAGHGAAYIFEKSPGNVWTQVAHLVPSDIDQRFLVGSQVALYGDLALVNSWNAPNSLGDGRVYVFQRDDLGNWVGTQKLTSPSALSTFGQTFAAIDGQILIGSGVNTPGKVHVFSEVPEPASTAIVGLIVFGAIGLSPYSSTDRRRRR